MWLLGANSVELLIINNGVTLDIVLGVLPGIFPGLDELTHVCKEAQLLIYVGYPWEKNIEEFLFCKDLGEKHIEKFHFCKRFSEGTTGEDICKQVDSFMQEHSLKWSQCLAVCIDGAASMTGIQSGLKA